MTNNTNNPNTNEPLFITVAEDPDDVPQKSDINNNDLNEFTSRSPSNNNNNYNLTQRNAPGPRKHAHNHKKSIKPANADSQFEQNNYSINNSNPSSIYPQDEYDPQYDVSYPDGSNNYNRNLPNNTSLYNQPYPPDNRREYPQPKHRHHNHHQHTNLRPNYNYDRTKRGAPLRYDNYPSSPTEFYDQSNENFYNSRHSIQSISAIQPMVQPIQAIQSIPIMMPVPMHAMPQVPQMPIVYQPLQLHTPISVQPTPLPTVSTQLTQPVIIQPQVQSEKLPAIHKNRTNRHLNEPSRSLSTPPPPLHPVKDSPRFIYNIHHYPPSTKSTKESIGSKKAIESKPIQVSETNYNIINKKPKKNVIF